MLFDGVYKDIALHARLNIHTKFCALYGDKHLVGARVNVTKDPTIILNELKGGFAS
jgi:hypothetical protein